MGTWQEDIAATSRLARPHMRDARWCDTVEWQQMSTDVADYAVHHVEMDCGEPSAVLSGPTERLVERAHPDLSWDEVQCRAAHILRRPHWCVIERAYVDKEGRRR